MRRRKSLKRSSILDRPTLRCSIPSPGRCQSRYNLLNKRVPAALPVVRPALHRPSITEGFLMNYKVRHDCSPTGMGKMERMKKSILILLRYIAFRFNRLGPYYWADRKLYELREVVVMPEFYYCMLFRVSMRLVQVHGFARLADKAIHTIPYHVRFYVA